MKIKTLAFITCVLGLAGSAAPALADGGRDGEPKDMADFLWEPDPPHRGTITVSYGYATDSDGPSTKGLRVAYGYLGRPRKDHPWGELWASFREDGETDVAAAGLAVVPVAKLSRRFGVGPLFDLGVSRRREPGDTDWTVIVGGGVEGVIRMARRWDLVTTAEAVYRIPSDIEFQARVGFRFHHEKLSPLGGGS